MKLSKEQKLLVNLIDDYDSYNLSLPYSEQLNRLYWGLTGDRVQKFIDSFYNGFAGFSRQHKNIINIYDKKLSEVISSLEIHVGDIPLGKTKQRVVSTIATTGINDVANHILKKYNADIGIVVNPNSGSVSFRRSKECKINLSDLATKIASGGGHAAAAGGTITEEFLNFTKLLEKI
jgi:oligoribonuclease NrnB/cAMP/cGMP phosphodiesterase (DHH superfamily)